MLLRILALSVAGSAIGATAQDEMGALLTASEPAPAAVEEQATADEIAMADVALLAEAVFVAADLNGDDKVDEQEFVAQGEAAAPAPTGEETATLSAADYLVAKFKAISGEDHEVPADELTLAYGADFQTADVDQNDVLEGEELAVFAALRRGEPAL